MCNILKAFHPISGMITSKIPLRDEELIEPAARQVEVERNPAFTAKGGRRAAGSPWAGRRLLTSNSMPASWQKACLSGV